MDLGLGEETERKHKLDKEQVLIPMATWHYSTIISFLLSTTITFYEANIYIYIYEYFFISVVACNPS